MTSPRSSYGGGYYAAPSYPETSAYDVSYPETPIYDMLVRQRGKPQIAPIRVPSVYDTGGAGSALAALPPALPSGHDPRQASAPSYGYQAPAPPRPQMPQPAPLQSAPAPMMRQAPAALPPGPGAMQQAPAPLQYTPAPHIPQQVPPRGYPGQGGPAPMQQPIQHQYQQPQQYQQQPIHHQPTQHMRTVSPQQMQDPYEDPYGGHQYPDRGY